MCSTGLCAGPTLRTDLHDGSDKAISIKCKVGSAPCMGLLGVREGV